ncbi:MAG TPA: DUF4351 domain-containing protein, partial [Nostocaceae cyanobacterium]|nr:DUF4351 domain-containing protein [Nostocaceae cyanobacterium]
REERQNIAGCVEILAGLRFDKNLIRQFLREDIMRESVIYQDIVQNTTLKIINTQIKRRFGNIDEAIFQKIRNLSTEKLDLLVEEFIDFSEVSDLVVWLDKQEQEN